MSYSQTVRNRKFSNKFIICMDLFMYLLKKHHYEPNRVSLRYDDNQHINAYTILGRNIIVISKGAIAKLSVLDVEALLFHEYGHVCQQSRIYIPILLICNTIFLIVTNFFSIKFILLWCFFLLLFLLSFFRNKELHADKFSSQILNPTIYIHLLKTLQKKSLNQFLLNKKMTISSFHLSFEALKCNIWLFIYDLFQIKQKISLFNVHPSYPKRIKYVEKNG